MFYIPLSLYIYVYVHIYVYTPIWNVFICLNSQMISASGSHVLEDIWSNAASDLNVRDAAELKPVAPSYSKSDSVVVVLCLL